jgi:hypothetical protein
VAGSGIAQFCYPQKQKTLEEREREGFTFVSPLFHFTFVSP